MTLQVILSGDSVRPNSPGRERVTEREVDKRPSKPKLGMAGAWGAADGVGPRLFRRDEEEMRALWLGQEGLCLECGQPIHEERLMDGEYAQASRIHTSICQLLTISN
jgi:hypothetical protein